MRPLSKKLLDFNTQLTSMSNYLTDANRTRLGVSSEQYATFTAIMDEWSPAFKAYSSPLTQTPAVLGEIHKLHKEALAFVRMLRRQIKHNGTITLTGDDYQSLYIHQDKKTATRINPPDYAPDIVLLDSHHLTNTFEAKRPGSENVGHLALPKHMKLARRLAITESASPAPPLEAYQPINNIGRSRFILTFSEADHNKTGWLICAYYNPRGEHGPESSPLSFSIV